MASADDSFKHRYGPWAVVTGASAGIGQAFARALAARTAGCQVVVSWPVGLESAEVELLDELTHDWAGGIEFVEHSDEQLVEMLESGKATRLRYADTGRVPQGVREAAARSGAYIADEPVSDHGRVELLWYFLEQSLTHVYHRYGNLGLRGSE